MEFQTQIRLLHHYNTLKILSVLTWTKELLSPLNSTICSVSTKLATLPCTSMPLVKSRVPARKQQRRDTIVHKNGLPFSEHWLIEITGLFSLRKVNRLWTCSPTPAEKCCLNNLWKWILPKSCKHGRHTNRFDIHLQNT